ncbi:JAB domain-containing protein [Blastococcus haudaquaticus]|uniref:DNA replication and repair protein RadC n=1 Tax=Blastococcus haudaquaticus TaxID=1938745 RepID=A0A286H422_9ACTN|nr:DNA repair protein RadC [Blastococcus haudaquaticus]SOE02550.1 DNA replication and repair protein RadC [Blastococcus haudaquaticus]
MGSDRQRITDLPVDQRPRERLRRLGADALTDAEIVAILIGAGRPHRNAVDLARDLIDSVGGVAGLVTATVDEVERVAGLGPAAAGRIMAATELRRRAALAAAPPTLSGSAGVAAAVLPHLQDRHRERMVVAVLDRRLRVLDVVTLAEGTTAHATAPTADILRTVLSRGGQAFALAHNHPGGSLEPSPTDRTTTVQVRAAAEACGLRFLDHLVVAGEDWRAI